MHREARDITRFKLERISKVNDEQTGVKVPKQGLVFDAFVAVYDATFGQIDPSSQIVD